MASPSSVLSIEGETSELIDALQSLQLSSSQAMSEYAASIIVPTSGCRSSLIGALDSLLRRRLSDCPFEVLVVGNGQASCDVESACKQVNKRHFPLRIICEQTPGLLAGRHRGVNESQADILVFVDDDIVASENWLASILQTFRDPSVHVVGGPCLPRFGATPPKWLEGFWHSTEDGGRWCGYLSLLDLGDKPRVVDPMLVWGLNFGIRKQTLVDLGGFNPDGYPWHLRRYRGDGETAVSVALREAGLKAVYHPEARVHHHVPHSRLTVDYFKRRAFLQGISRSYTEIRRHGAIVDMPSKTAPVATGESPERRFGRYARRPVHHARNFLRRQFRRGTPPSQAPSDAENPEVADVKQRVRESYLAGYEFHQDEVRNDPELLKWVLRPDYWDYRLPKNARSFAPDLPDEALHDN